MRLLRRIFQSGRNADSQKCDHDWQEQPPTYYGRTATSVVHVWRCSKCHRYETEWSGVGAMS